MKSSIFLICFAALSLHMSAQKPVPNTGAEESEFTVPLRNSWLDKFEKRQTKMIEILNLTKQQKHSLDTLNDRYVTQKAMLHDDNALNLRARLARLEIMRRERETNFRNLLTDTQLEKWNDLRKTQRKKTFRKK